MGKPQTPEVMHPSVAGVMIAHMLTVILRGIYIQTCTGGSPPPPHPPPPPLAIRFMPVENLSCKLKPSILDLSKTSLDFTAH